MTGITVQALPVSPSMRFGILTALLGLVTLGACQAPTPPEPSPPTPEPEVLVAGCDAWFAHNVCESKGPLTVWIEGETPVPIELPGWTASEPVPSRGGFRRILQPPAPKTRSVLRYGPHHREVVTVVTTTTTPAVDAQLEAMDTEALLELAPTLALDGRAKVLDVVRRRIMKARGLRASLGAAQWLAGIHEGRKSDTAAVRFRAIATMIHLGASDLARARAQIEEFPAYRPSNARARMLDGYHRALVERDSGAAHRSASALFQVEAVSDRIQDRQLAIAASQVALPLLGPSGLGHLAADIEERLIARTPHLGARSRAQVLTNIAWSRLVRREADLGSGTRLALLGSDEHTSQTTRLLRTAHRLFRQSGAETDNSLLNLALDATQRGAYAQAEAELVSMNHAALSSSYRYHRDLLLARISLREMRLAEAARRYKMILELPGLPELHRWESLTGLAEAVESRNAALALSLLTEAESLANEIGRQSSLLSNLSQHSARTLASSRALVDLLAGQGDCESASRAARSARRRLAAVRSTALRLQTVGERTRAEVDSLLATLRTNRVALDQLRRDLWSVPRDKKQGVVTAIRAQEDNLSTTLGKLLDTIKGPKTEFHSLQPSPGQVLVLLFPGRSQWWVLVHTASQVQGHAIPSTDGTLDLTALGAILDSLLPDSPSIDEVRFYATAASTGLDLHTVLFRGQPLGLQLPVTYALDAGPTAVAGRSGRRALLVGTPSAYLNTEAEIREVGRSLARRGYELAVPQKESLRTANIANALNAADLFHFAGHAEASDHAVRSGLRLQEAEWLSAADILALRHCPRTVVLAACETARPDASAAGWTLAEAFIAAGAQEVLATQRKVEDKLASQIARRVHAEDVPLHVALHRAVSDVAKDNPEADWAAFRVLVP